MARSNKIMKANEEKKDLTVDKAEEERTPEEKALDLTPEQEEALLKSMEEAKMPIEFTDGKFKLGERELDIRNLSRKNKEQLLFRMMVHEVSYQRSIHQDLIDVMKLVMLILKHFGVEDIVKETEKLEMELLEKVKNQTKAN